MSTSWTMSIRAHAKINLSLRITGRRPDGYHELKTVYQSLALHDLLELRPRPGPFTLLCDDPAVPTDQRNLVWRAAALVWRAARRRGAPAGVEVRLVKRVPAQGGLGGGSADAAAALVALAALWDARLDDDSVNGLAGQLGADVPYFLVGGTALGLGRGDEIYPLDDRCRNWVALALPPFGVSTAEAFGWADQGHARAAAPAPGESPVLPSVRAWDGVNDLEREVMARYPEIGRLTAALRRAGAEVAAMTGSGSTVFGLFATRAEAQAAVRRLGRGACRALVTRTLSRAEYRRRSRPVLANARPAADRSLVGKPGSRIN